MLSIFLLAAGLVIAAVAMRRSRARFPRVLALVLVNVLLVECVVYAYFAFLVYRGTCFTLIGNQAVLDGLIKARLLYATYFAQGRRSFIYQLDNDLGYTVGKDKHAPPYRTNRMGLRADREYSLDPPASSLRLACFGDSFVFCDGERNQDCWTSVLEGSVGNLEVLNFGVSGYGLSQAFTRYLKDGLRFSPDVVFINYVLLGDRDAVAPTRIASGNLRLADFYRITYSYENGALSGRVTTPFDFFDPEFRSNEIYAAAGVDTAAAPLSWALLRHTNTGLLAKHVLLGRRFRTAPPPQEALELGLNEKIIALLVDTAVRHGSDVILFCPHALDELPQPIRATLGRHAEHAVYVDSRTALSRVIAAAGEIDANVHNDSNHFNARGNRLYAQAILQILSQRAWGHGARRFSLDAASTSFTPR